jgi:hypothetical protein
MHRRPGQLRTSRWLVGCFSVLLQARRRRRRERATENRTRARLVLLSLLVGALLAASAWGLLRPCDPLSSPPRAVVTEGPNHSWERGWNRV